MTQAQDNNPLLAPWRGAWGGMPPFDKVRLEDVGPAMDSGMAEETAEITAIAENPEPATFENTVAALERTGEAFDRAATVYSVFSSTMSSQAFREIEKAIDPKRSAHSDAIIQNAALFARIEAVYEARHGLESEQQRLAWLIWDRFVRAGARLDPDAKARISGINQRLSSLYNRFSENLLADEEAFTAVSEAEMAGLPEAVKAGARQAAKDHGHTADGLVINTRSSVEPYLSYATDRGMREVVWRAFVGRGDNNDDRDNKTIIREILALRFERAQLLGFETHAHWRLQNAMAKNPQNAMALMEKLWGPAVQRVREEVADMQAIADAEGAGLAIEPWDYRYYAEKVRAAKYDLDLNEAQPYLQLEKMREALFWTAEKIFGLQFAPVEDAPVYHPDVRVWRVSDGAGSHVGLYYFDPYARSGKRSGAWMNQFRPQRRLGGVVTPVVSNTCNFIKGAPGEPVLIGWDDAVTLFHEFGHALHGLISDVTYPSLSGTAVPRDYVEFPSQLNEHWLLTDEVLDRFAVHHQTGEPIPRTVVERIKRADRFNQGFATVEFLASALIDMKLHLTGGAEIDPDAFEREELSKLGMPREIVMRHRTPQFGHVFGSDGYSAGYYSYLWADALTADCAEAFEQAPGGYFDLAVARRLKDTVLSKGNTLDPVDQYRAFRGRDPDPAALMRKRGFA